MNSKPGRRAASPGFKNFLSQSNGQSDTHIKTQMNQGRISGGQTARKGKKRRTKTKKSATSSQKLPLSVVRGIAAVAFLVLWQRPWTHFLPKAVAFGRAMLMLMKPSLSCGPQLTISREKSTPH
ncbi:hypothetical protein ABE25_20625 [Cytobacillus firmus]|nr:hypothetical protein [Cytobacillus firmus]MBG9604456.1 hypothetical protein [Cytobacillus firmus]MBG9655906.1 hypothetical protein [Cytobacillus firmus]